MVEIENNANALLHLQTHYSTLRASEKRIADYILSRPDEIIYLSITSLANECHTSETSVIRLCHHGAGRCGFRHQPHRQQQRYR